MSHRVVSPMPESNGARLPRLTAVSSILVWSLFLAASVLLAWSVTRAEPVWQGPMLLIDGLTIVLWLAVSFFSGIVHVFSRRYMAGTRRIGLFFARLLAFTVCAAAFVAANHLLLMTLAWLGMGLIMAGLIGHVEGWRQAQTAKTFARRRFLLSAALLASGFALLGWLGGSWNIVEVLSWLASTEAPAALALVAVLLIAAAAIQCALIPMHTWLLSSMTAPTPASALMHAGFVNGGGVLLTRFAPVFGVVEWSLTLLLVLGAVSAIAGKVLKSLQPEVKRQLGCSTIGQMGFMLMQAGLGFFSAAITHLILHGCYKAYLFLGVGERLHHHTPRAHREAPPITRFSSLIAGLALGVVGGWLFLVLTGKGLTGDTGLLLGLFVGLTVLHSTRDVLGNLSLPTAVRMLGVPLTFFPLIVIYALVFNGVRGVIGGLPGVDHPAALSPVHYIIGSVFVTGYAVIELGWHQNLAWLYVKLINLSQPAADTATVMKREYYAY